MSGAEVQMAGACLLAAILLWATATILTGWAMDKHRTRFAAYRQSCADAFDQHCDDVAALFPPVSVDELAARRGRGGPTT